MGAICRLQIEKFSHFSVAKMGQNAAKGQKWGNKRVGYRSLLLLLIMFNTLKNK